MAERGRFYEALHRNLSDDQLDQIVQRLITRARWKAISGLFVSLRIRLTASPVIRTRSTARSSPIELL
jgi:hypothetical protein